MANDKANWKVIISVENRGQSVNYIYGVTYEQAYASVQRQINGDNRILGFLITEA